MLRTGDGMQQMRRRALDENNVFRPIIYRKQAFTERRNYKLLVTDERVVLPV